MSVDCVNFLWSDEHNWMGSDSDGQFAIGSVFRKSDNLQISVEKFGAELKRHAPDRSLTAYSLNQHSGFFAIATTLQFDGAAAFICVDHVRSIPLFYAIKKLPTGDSLLISHEFGLLAAELDEVEPLSATIAEFELCGYLTGSKTIHPQIQQVPAGHFVVFSRDADGKITADSTSYFEFLTGRESKVSDGEIVDGLGSVMEGCIDRLCRAANGSQIVIPLSGGYDSRYIAMALARRNYPDILAFSYGLKNDAEAEISRRIADELGIAWEFVPYSNEEWRDWIIGDEAADFLSFAHQGSSTPHVQDALAISRLNKSGVIDQDSFIVPGHSGDFIAGSHIPAHFETGSEIGDEIVFQAIMDKHFRLWEFDSYSETDLHQIRQGLKRQLNLAKVASATEAIAKLEAWNHRERQAKFIVNSVRCYEFFGLKWWLPLYDKEFVDFFRSVPLEMRCTQKLYNEHVASRYAEFTGINMDQAVKTDRSNILHGLWKQIMRNPALLQLARLILYRFRKNVIYERSKLAMFGMIDRQTFNRHYTGRQTINSFIAKHMTGSLPL